MRTETVADMMKLAPKTVREHLAKAEALGLIGRIGQRSGWAPPQEAGENYRRKVLNKYYLGETAVNPEATPAPCQPPAGTDRVASAGISVARSVLSELADERAAILEYDAGLDRFDAEQVAGAEVGTPVPPVTAEEG